MTAQSMSLGEFVKQLTVRMHNSNVPMPFKDERPWHTLLYRLKRSNIEPKPIFLSNLQFDWDGPYPRSRDLSDYIHGLHFTGCVSATNPSYEEIELDEQLEKIWSSEKLDNDMMLFMDKVIDIVKKEFPV